ncbi:hypothetical protein GW17_00052301 [Ensete ventricosum]|nr:hypothetical protein GW17_00052301 [Ensete ventricosum]
MQWDFAGSSLGDSPKESRSSLGTRREITGKKTGGLAARLPEVAGVCGNPLLGLVELKLSSSVDQRAGQHKSQAGIRKVEETTFVEISAAKPLRSIVWIPLERMTLDLLHLLHPDLEYRDIQSL